MGVDASAHFFFGSAKIEFPDTQEWEDEFEEKYDGCHFELCDKHEKFKQLEFVDLGGMSDADPALALKGYYFTTYARGGGIRRCTLSAAKESDLRVEFCEFCRSAGVTVNPDDVGFFIGANFS